MGENWSPVFTGSQLTHTDRYLHYSSHHHPMVKSGIADCLHHRAERICKQKPALTGERKHVQNVLMANGYPRRAAMKKQKRRRDAHWSGRPKARVFLPYIKGLSEKIGRACRPLGIQTTFSSRNTLRRSLTKVKETHSMMDVKGVVYSIPCAECSSVNVGETGRTLKVRMAEHRRAVKNMDPKMELPCISKRLHMHAIDWQEARILVREENWGRKGFSKPLRSSKEDQ